MMHTSIHSPKPHNRWLILIAAYKLLQALLFVAIGLGARHLLHKDVGDELQALVDRLNFNSEPRLVDFLLAKAMLLNDPLLKKVSFAAFSYGSLSLAEGIGLYLEKVWGEYLTLIITASFLPFELLEVVHKLSWVSASLLSINTLVLFYLLMIVIENRRKRRQEAQQCLDVQK